MRRLLPIALLAACEGAERSPQDDGGAAPECDLFPLAVGARWTYRDTNSDGEERDLVKAIDRCEVSVFDDCLTGVERSAKTYVQSSSEADEVDDSGLTFLVPLPEGVVRVRQEVWRDGALDQVQTYSPYFMRLMAGPYETGRSESFTHDRCEYDPAGTLTSHEVRHYRHEILGEEEVTVPAGTFAAIAIERTDLDDGDVKRYWFACGVGKVLERKMLEDGSVGGSEELAAYEEGQSRCED